MVAFFESGIDDSLGKRRARWHGVYGITIRQRLASQYWIYIYIQSYSTSFLV
jgi:hypothetical protein